MSDRTGPPLVIRRDNLVAKSWGPTAGTWFWNCRACRTFGPYAQSQHLALEAAMYHWRTARHTLP